MRNRFLLLLSSVAVGIVIAFAALSFLGSEASAKPIVAAMKAGTNEVDPPTSAELGLLWNSYQSERAEGTTSGSAKSRVERVQKLVSSNRLHSGTDYYYAAVLLTEGTTADASLLAHDLAVAALAMGDLRAKSVAAYSEDQFLTRLSRPQRYGTQVKQKAGKTTLSEVDPGVTDAMRQLLGLPSVIAAKQLAESGKSMDTTLLASTTAGQRRAPGAAQMKIAE